MYVCVYIHTYTHTKYPTSYIARHFYDVVQTKVFDSYHGRASGKLLYTTYHTHVRFSVDVRSWDYPTTFQQRTQTTLSWLYPTRH